MKKTMIFFALCLSVFISVFLIVNVYTARVEAFSVQCQDMNLEEHSGLFDDPIWIFNDSQTYNDPDGDPIEHINEYIQRLDCYEEVKGRHISTREAWLRITDVRLFAEELGMDSSRCVTDKKNEICQGTLSNCATACYEIDDSDQENACLKNCGDTILLPCNLEASKYCEAEFKKLVLAYGNKTQAKFKRICNPNEFIIDGNCRTSLEICGGYIAVYDPETQECFCDNDLYRYVNGKCTHIDELDNIKDAVDESCWNDEVFVDGKCEKINKFCGNDSLVQYDSDTEECYCPANYKFENSVCQEAGGIELNIRVASGFAEPPFLADGQTKTRFLISAKYKEDNSLADLRFEIGYTRTEQKGNINVSGDKNGYIVEYQTADLGEVEGQPADSLYIWYFDKNKEKEEREQYQITLYTPMASPAVIEKEGMKTLEATLPFEAKKAEIFIYYLEDNVKYPIANVKIKYEGDKEALTNRQGKAEVQTSQKLYGEEIKTIEFEMELDGRLVTMQTQGKRHYDELGASEQGIYNFLNDLPKEIAKADNRKDEEQIKAAAFAIGYSLAIMNDSQKLSKDSSANIARVVADTLNDLLDMTGAVEKFTKFITKPLDDLGDQALNLTPEEFKQLYNKLVKLPLKYINSMWGKFRYVVLERVPFLNPRIIDFLYDELLADYVNDLAGIPTLEEIKEGKIGEAQDYLKESIESFLKKFDAEEMAKKALDDYYQERVNELLALANQKIAQGDLSLALVETYAEIARDDYVAFAEQYLGQTAKQYSIDMFRAYADLVKNLVLESIDKITLFTAPQFYVAVSKTTKAIKESYDKFDTLVLNNVELFSWFSVLGKNTSMMEKAVIDLMQLSLAKQKRKSLFFVNVALAAEPADYQPKDELQIMYDNEVGADNPDRKTVFEYVSSKDKLDLYQDLFFIMGIVVKGDPENTESGELLAELDQEVKVLGARVADIKEKVDGLDILKPKEPESKDGYDSKTKGHAVYYLITAIIIIVIVGAISFWQKDKLKAFFVKNNSKKI